MGKSEALLTWELSPCHGWLWYALQVIYVSTVAENASSVDNEESM